ncbi:MAG: hypothetical protein QGD88_06435 [Anaerolineae bacterium]|nr:hypothetical protein [Anaerolineae bacterium]
MKKRLTNITNARWQVSVLILIIIALVLLARTLISNTASTATETIETGALDTGATATKAPATEPVATEEMAEANILTVVSWGGEYQEAQTNAFFGPFGESTGITVIQDTMDYSKLEAMVESGQVTWDVVDITNEWGIGKTEQYFEPIDYSIVPKDSILAGFANEYRWLTLFMGQCWVTTHNLELSPKDGRTSSI